MDIGLGIIGILCIENLFSNHRNEIKDNEPYIMKGIKKYEDSIVL